MRRCLSMLALLGLAACSGCGSDANPVAPTPVFTVLINTPPTTFDGENALPLNATVTGGRAPMTYRWSATGGRFDDPAVLRATWHVPAAQPSVRNYTVRLTVTDAGGTTSTDTVVFTVRAAWPVRAVDPRFDDAFWRALVYNQYEAPNTYYTRSRVMVDPGRLNVYVDVSEWPAALPQSEWLPWIERQWGGWIRQMTGQTWTGRLESGPARSLMGGGSPGWIVIQWDGQLGSRAACGTAPVGNWPDRGYITLRRGAWGCSWSSYMTETLPHELVHVLGFSHVSDPLAVMHAPAARPPFTAREQYHMQLAYEVGRDRPYCGWPYSPACGR